jgi:hypothetical protein
MGHRRVLAYQDAAERERRKQQELAPCIAAALKRK